MDALIPYSLKAGASVSDITPEGSHFLFGYPYVERISTGVHDPLLSSALYLSDGREQVLFISNDVIYVNKESVARIRSAIFKRTKIPASNILVAATHTHSAPVTAEVVISMNDPVVPRVDQEYLKFMEDSAIEAAVQAYHNSEDAEIGFVKGDASGMGTNRHNPDGAKDMEVPAMLVRNRNKEFIACMLVCSMHPTILHEDSTLYSSDFPNYVRKSLQKELLGDHCPVVYFTGTAGNQSPRHVTKANTFSEAERIGEIVANAVKSKMSENVRFTSMASISVDWALTDLPRRTFPSVEWSENHRKAKKEQFEKLKKSSETSQEIRTAEVNWFGAEELLFLSSMTQTDSLEEAYDNCLPAEIQVIKVGEWTFAAWPGEVFVEFGLALKEQFSNISLITYANGELQGYIVTREAHEKGFYEAGNSLFDYSAGEIMIGQTVELLKKLC